MPCRFPPRQSKEEINMARKTDYSNTQKYSNRKSFDGQPIPEGKVLVPFRIELYGLKKSDYIDGNCTTMHLGEFSYHIGFMAINESSFASYMKDFWNDLNKDMEMRREGRCIIGTNPDGSIKTCPYTRRCKDCPNKGLLERHNPKRVEILSLDYEYDGESFDIEDDSQPSVEDQVIERLCPEPTIEELQIKLLAHFDKENPRYAKIIRLSLQGVSIDDICVQINLKPSRGRQEINNAHDAVCEYLRLSNHKRNRK